jgi:hypothetical protein
LNFLIVLHDEMLKSQLGFASGVMRPKVHTEFRNKRSPGVSPFRLIPRDRVKEEGLKPSKG